MLPAAAMAAAAMAGVSVKVDAEAVPVAAPLLPWLTAATAAIWAAI